MSIRKFKEGIQLESLSAAPSNPIEGQIYYADGTGVHTEGLWVYDGATWVAVGAGSGGGISAWVSGTSYTSSPSSVVYYTDNKIYRCITSNSDAVFTPVKWQALSVESVTTGNLTESTSSVLTINSGTNAVVGSGTSIQVKKAATGQDGYLSSTDWNSFHQKFGKNYIANFDALVDTAGWAVYADAAAATPVDGTGGSPNVTITRNTTTPLRGVSDFLFTKDAANRQGQGFSYDFTIDKADQAKPCYVSFDYSVSSNYSYTNNDLVFYIYDITNAVLIQPVPYILDGSGKAKFEFQTNANSTSYRLIGHIATTSSLAYTLNFVNVVVSETPAPSMINVQDKQYDISGYLSSSPSISSVYRAVAVPYKTKTGTWRLKGNISYLTSTTSTDHTLTISGVTFRNTGSSGQAVMCTQFDAGGGNTSRRAYATDNNSTLQSSFDTARQYIAWSFDVELASAPTWAVDFYPVSLSDGAETRVISCRYTKSSQALSNSSFTTIVFDTKTFDTHSAFNTSTGFFTAPVSGYYNVKVGLQYTNKSFSGTQNTIQMALDKNGSQYSKPGYLGMPVASNMSGGLRGADTIYLNAGDYIGISGYSENSITYDTLFIEVDRISGPATIAASEFVGINYTDSSGITLTGSGGNTTILYANKVFDTHNAFNTSTGEFTAPSAGKYYVMMKASPYYASASLYADRFSININGSSIHMAERKVQMGGDYCVTIVESLLNLNVGDKVKAVFTNYNSSVNLAASSEFNNIVIFKAN